MTQNVLPCETDAETGTSEKLRKPPNDTFTMVRQSSRTVQRLVVSHRVERKTSTSPQKWKKNQNSKHWILTLNAEGPQPPLNQRPDFARAKRECKRVHDEDPSRTQEEYRTFFRSQEIRQRNGQQFEGNEEYDNAVDPKTGWRFYTGSLGNLQKTSSSSSHWDQTHWKNSSSVDDR